MAMYNYYKVLGIGIEASRAEIRRSYHLLAKKHHPDSGGDAELFRQICIAYFVLSDPQSRKDYDRKMGFVKTWKEKKEPLARDSAGRKNPYTGNIESAWNLWNEMFGEEQARTMEEYERGWKHEHERSIDAEDLWEDGYGGYASGDEDDIMASYYRFSKSMHYGNRK